MTDRRATSRPGDSFQDDGYYRPIEAKYEKQYGLPDGMLSTIRTKGERSNRNQVSSAGARSVYQITPSTKDLFLKKYGVNAYAGDEAAAKVAALHLKESMDRTGGDMVESFAQYHAGPSGRGRGNINAGYVSRTTGGTVLAKGIVSVAGRPGVTTMAPGVDVSDFSIEELQNTAPADLGSRKPLGSNPEKKAKQPSVAQIIGGNTLTPAGDIGAPDTSDVKDNFTDDTNTEAQKQTIGFTDRVMAAVDKNWILNQLIRGMDQEDNEGDPAWHKTYMQKQPQLEEFAADQDELDMLRSSRAQRSEADFRAVQTDILARRRRNAVINSSGNGLAFELGTSLLDPVGWIATAGIGKVLQVGGKAATLGKMAAEGAITNVGFTAAIDYSGEDQSVGDYITSAGIGLALGAALHPVVNARGADRSAAQSIETEIAAATQHADEIAQEARILAPEGASPTELKAAEQSVVVSRADKELQYGLGNVEDADKFLSPDEVLTANPGVRKAVEDSNNLGLLEDDADRAMHAEMAARSEGIVTRFGKIIKGLEGKLLRAFGLESDGVTMLRSGSNVLKAAAINLLEITTGAGGRKSSASIQQVMRERAYMRHMIGIDEAADVWRKAEGIGKVSWHMSPDHRARFERDMFYEVSRREGTPSGTVFTTNPAVARAADAWERGMDQMRVEMQAAKVLGHERLGDTSRGYMLHMIDPRKLLALTPDQKKGVEDILAKQFTGLNEYTYINKEGEKIVKAFDKDFSRKLAKAYIGKAERRGMGTYDVPANLHTSEAADIISDALDAMKGLDEEAKQAVLGRYSRGGAAFTKGRLKLDLTADIGDGVMLGDVFRQDALGLYRGYSRRVSGEVALAQYGIHGQKGLEMIRSLAERQGATVDELKAFERVAAEFLNMPWKGAKRVPALDNVRLVTSAAKLGGMGFTQVGEFGNAIAAVGVKAVLSNIGSANRLRKEVGMLMKGGESKNAILRDFDATYGALGTDGYNLQRIFDTPDNAVELYSDESIGRFGKAIRAGSHFNTVASGHRVMLAVQTRGMAEQILKKAMRYVKEGKESVALADMGFTKEVTDHLKEHMDQIATFDAKGRLTGLDLYAADLDPRIVQTMAASVERGAGQIIQRTFIGEQGKWAHDDLLKMLFQFRTFSLTSIEKQYGRNNANYGAVKSFAILAGSMAFALPIHAARVQAKMVGMSRKEREDYTDRNMSTMALTRATLNYASSAGLLGDFLDVTSVMGSKVGLIPEQYATVSGARTGSQGLGSVVPGLGMADDIYKGTLGAQFSKLPKMIPGSNLPFVTPLVNGLTPDKD